MSFKNIIFQKSFSSYIKHHFKQANSLAPLFSSYTCTQFFCSFFRPINHSKSFTIPSWIPPLAEPSILYNLSPSYQQVTKRIRRLEASGSPYPLDEISIIPFKRSPYLRSYITAVSNFIWQSGEIPADWKKAWLLFIRRVIPQIHPISGL